MLKLGVFVFGFCFLVLDARQVAFSGPVQLVPDNVRPCAVPCSRTAIIFFHGYTGSRATWINSSTQFYWPAGIGNDPDLGSKIDVYRLDYDSFQTSGPSIDEIESQLGLVLDPLMIEKRYSKVVFVAHSLGGIVAQAYLLHVLDRYGHRALARFPLLFALATPYEGSSLASIASFISNNPQLRVLVPIETNDFQQLLNRTANDIAGKHAQCDPTTTFHNMSNYAAFEGVGTSVVGTIVSEQSATRFAQKKIRIDRDHMDLPKPPNRSDSLYKWVKTALLSCGSSQGVCAVPTDRCPTGDFP